MGVARQAPAAATRGFVCELKAQGEDKGQDELDKCLAIVNQLKVSGLIIKIDGNRVVLSCCFDGLGHVSSLVKWLFCLMTHHGDNLLKFQAQRNGFRTYH